MGPLGCPLLVFCFVSPLPIMKVQFKGKQEDLFLKSNIFCFLVGHPNMRHTHSKRHKYLEVFGLFVSFFPGTARPNRQQKGDLEH
jgi:hypothetical protein